jgi:Cu/Ag efflux pump CusA
MRRLAAPMIGGLITAYIGVLLILPVLFDSAKRIAMHRQFRQNRNDRQDPREAA